jgi:hypothetical protein
VAFGILGVILYFMITISGIGTAYRASGRRHDSTGLFVIGATTVTLLQWFNGDLYSTTWLVWLTLGFADQAVLRRDDDELELATDAASLSLPPELVNRRRWIQPT